MTTEQIRVEIKNAVDKLPDRVLPNILSLLKDLIKYHNNDLELIAFIHNTFKEDKALLEKLAH